MTNYILKEFGNEGLIGPKKDLNALFHKTFKKIYTIEDNFHDIENTVTIMKEINDNLYKFFQNIYFEQMNIIDSKKIYIHLNETISGDCINFLEDKFPKNDIPDDNRIFFYDKNDDKSNSYYIAPLAWLYLFGKFPEHIYNNPEFIQVYIQTIWIILKWTGLALLNINDYAKLLVEIINHKTRENYIIIDCGVSHVDKNYSCGRAITVNQNNFPVTRNDLPVIIIFNTVSSENMDMDPEQATLLLYKYKNKYLKYKQKYLKLKTINYIK